MTGHVHAALMALYAQDAAETGSPWNRWQAMGESEVWVDMDGPCQFHEMFDYRRKPRAIRIGAFEVPEPLRQYPDGGTVVYMADTRQACARSFRWRDCAMHQIRIEMGLCHLTAEAAKTHIRALLSFTEAKP